LSIWALALKFGTSPAMWHGKAEASSSEMGRMPHAPATSASQNASGVEPIGLRTPNPVSTVRRGVFAMSATRY
jgi:hypothetical protein